MSLQRRLTLFFIVIVMLPLLAAGLVVRYVVVGEVERRAEVALKPALDAATVAYNIRSASLDEVVIASISPSPIAEMSFGRLLRDRRAAALRRVLSERLGNELGTLDFLSVLGKNGQPLAFVTARPGVFVDGVNPSPPDVLGVARDLGRQQRIGYGRGFVTTGTFPVVDSRGTQLGSVVGGFWLDRGLLVSSTQESAELAIISNGDIVASTAPEQDPVRMTGSDGAVLNRDVAHTAQQNRLNSRAVVLAWSPKGPIENLSDRVFLSMLGLLVLALLPIAILAYWLAKLITQPLEEVSRGAEAISQGRFDYLIPVESRDEVGQLAIAFNEMTRRLRGTITELSSSRHQLQRAVQRVGETLRSTHDMRQILESILNTASDAVVADAALLWSFTPNRAEMSPAIGRGLDLDDFERVRVGHGIVGHVAERGTTILVPAAQGGPRASFGEPSFPVAIAVPLYSQDRIHAVITLYRRDEQSVFTSGDLDTVVFLAEQGGVALENVQLHEEAQRLAITDGLTGVWNRRYFQMQFRQVLATSVRFERAFSVLMLDLDNFKLVNDNYGHQRGDAILIEFAQRVSKMLREVDTVARYGGEEFICLLSETDVEGATITAEKILDAIRSETFDHPTEEPVHLTASIGVAAFPDHGDSYQTLVGAADGAMYRAKQEGRDCARIAEKPRGGLKLAT